MEAFSLSGASGWQTLSSLLNADSTFTGKFLWTFLYIKNTHGSQTMIVKSLPGSTAPAADSGINLGAGASFTWEGGTQGIIDGNAIWVKCSGAATSFDISFIKKAGI